MSLRDGLLISLLWLGLVVLESRVTRRNWGSSYNGYGAIAGTLERSNQAPMRYRVLASWLVGLLPKRWRLEGYLVLKALLLGASLFAAWPLIGTAGVIVLAAMMAVTFEFDYWECYVELAAVCLCLYGQPAWALLGALAWGLSKETVFLAPVLAFCAGGWVPGIAALSGPLAFWLVMRHQGKAALYEGRWTERRGRYERARQLGATGPVRALFLAAICLVGPYNPDDLALSRRRYDGAFLLSTVWTVALIVAAFSGCLPARLQATAWVALGWPLAALALVRFRETRVLLPVALWIGGIT